MRIRHRLGPLLVAARALAAGLAVLPECAPGAGLESSASGPVPAAASCAAAGDTSDLIPAAGTANGSPGPNTIALGGGTCSLIAPNSDWYWYGPNALRAIASDVTIEGNGSAIERDSPAPSFSMREEASLRRTPLLFDPGGGPAL